MKFYQWSVFGLILLQTLQQPCNANWIVQFVKSLFWSSDNDNISTTSVISMSSTSSTLITILPPAEVIINSMLDSEATAGNGSGILFFQYLFNNCSTATEKEGNDLFLDNSTVTKVDSHGNLTVRPDDGFSSNLSAELTDCSSTDIWAVCLKVDVPLSSSNTSKCQHFTTVTSECGSTRYGFISLNASRFLELELTNGNLTLASCEGNLTFVRNADQLISTDYYPSTQTAVNTEDGYLPNQSDSDEVDVVIIAILSALAVAVIIVITITGIIIYKRKHQWKTGSNMNTQHGDVYSNVRNNSCVALQDLTAFPMSQSNNSTAPECAVYSETVHNGQDEVDTSEGNQVPNSPAPHGVPHEGALAEEGATLYTRLHQPTRNFTNTYDSLVKTSEAGEKTTSPTFHLTPTAESDTYSRHHEPARNFTNTYDEVGKGAARVDGPAPTTEAEEVSESHCPQRKETDDVIYCNDVSMSAPTASVYSHLGEHARQLPSQSYDHWPIAGAENISPPNAVHSETNEEPENYYGNIGSSPSINSGL